MRKTVFKVVQPTSHAVLAPLNCGGGISSTIKANYYKMGVANFVREKGKDGFCAPAIMIKYE